MAKSDPRIERYEEVPEISFTTQGENAVQGVRAHNMCGDAAPERLEDACDAWRRRT